MILLNSLAMFSPSAFANASSIHGPDTVCRGAQNIIYSIDSVQGATAYQWTIPSGIVLNGPDSGNAITVSVSTWAQSGSVCVRPVFGSTQGQEISKMLHMKSASGVYNQQTFLSGGPIIISDNYKASIYPSSIFVNGFSGLIADLNVYINGLSHTFPDDIDILLVSPAGHKITIMSDCGGGNNLSNASLVFDDSATLYLPDANTILSGRYKPVNYISSDFYIAPGPGWVSSPVSVSSTKLSSLSGTNANGEWKLYVTDDSPGNSGSFSSWSLQITAESHSVLLQMNGPHDIVEGDTAIYFVGSQGVDAHYDWTIPQGAVLISLPDSNAVSVFFPKGCTSGPLQVNTYNNCGNGLSSKPVFINVFPDSIQLVVKMFIQSMYVGNERMRSLCMADTGIVDSILISLYSTDLKNQILFSATASLNSEGFVTVRFPRQVYGNSFYLSVRASSFLETWSSVPLEFDVPFHEYDFTISVYHTFGENVCELPDGLFAFWSGDLNQDGSINATDLFLLEQSMINFAGCGPGDMNADGITESADYSMLENNLQFNLNVTRP